MKLFVDDLRWPSEVGLKNEEWAQARNYDDAVRYITEHKPQRIAFDHDLSTEHYAGNYSEDGPKTGYDLATWLIEQDKANPQDGYITKDFIFTCHSASPRGKARIEHVLNRYLQGKRHD